MFKSFISILSSAKAVLILLSFLAVSCSSYQVKSYKSDKEIKRESIDYKDYWSAMILGSQDFVEKREYTEEEAKLAKAIKHITDNDMEKSLPIFRDLFENGTENDSTHFRYFAYRYLFGYYQQASRIDSCKLIEFQYDSTIYPDAYKEFELYHKFLSDKNTRVEFGKKSDTLKMLDNDPDLPLAEVIIKGKKYKFLFDTGAMISFIGKDLAKEQNLQYLSDNNIPVATSNSKMAEAFQSFIPELSFGSTVAYDYPLFVSSEENMDIDFLWIFTILECDGIIGWPIIKELDIIFDYENKQIIINKPYVREVENKNFYWAFHPIVKLRSNKGNDINAFFDSGANSGELKELILQKVPNDDLGTSWGFTSGIGGGLFFVSDEYPELDLFTNGKKIKISNIEIVEDTKQILKYDLILGSDLGRKHWIRLDAKNGIFDFGLNK